MHFYIFIFVIFSVNISSVSSEAVHGYDISLFTDVSPPNRQ